MEAEQQRYSYTHQQLGSLLLEDWGLPDSITVPMRYHHQPDLAPDHIRETAAILDVANLLSAIYSGSETAAHFRELRDKMEYYFSISQEETRDILDKVAVQAVSILEIFDIDPGNIKPYSQILQEANDELGKLNLSYEQLVLELKESKEKSERFAQELQRANSRLEQLAFRDGLTDIYNHRYFQEILDTELARARRYGNALGLLLFDIDSFKRVNDNYGHPVGDKVLINIAKEVGEALRPSDILARYGGEEFAVILPEISSSGLRVFAERLRRCVEAVCTKVGTAKIKVTISSGGVCLIPDAQMSKQQLIDIADQGLYQSKKGGRNRVTILDAV